MQTNDQLEKALDLLQKDVQGLRSLTIANSDSVNGMDTINMSTVDRLADQLTAVEKNIASMKEKMPVAIVKVINAKSNETTAHFEKLMKSVAVALDSILADNKSDLTKQLADDVKQLKTTYKTVITKLVANTNALESLASQNVSSACVLFGQVGDNYLNGGV